MEAYRGFIEIYWLFVEPCGGLWSGLCFFHGGNTGSIPVGRAIAYGMVCSLGYDADQIAGALIAYSNNGSTYGQARFPPPTLLALFRGAGLSSDRFHVAVGATWAVRRHGIEEIE